MTETDFDVAVIGLGPAGAVAAGLLGQAGLRVLVVDKSHSLFDKPRAVSMDHEVMRVFQGLGVADQVAPLTAPFTVSEHYGAAGQLIRRVGMLPPPYPMGWTPTMAFLQPQLEQVLRDHLRTLPSVEVQLGQTLVALSQDAQQVTLGLRGDNGAETSRTARWLIGCDGASSTVRGLAGLVLDDLDFDEPWLVIDLLANERGLAKLPKVSTHFCEPSRPTMLVVCTGNHRRFEMMLRPGETPAEVETEANVWSLLSRWITPDDATMWRRACYRFHAVVGSEWRQGRVFLAGDAAHQQPPFLGQGMCQGVRDVANLSWKLQQVMAGQAGDELLDSYREERAAHVRALTAMVKRIGRYICELDPAAAAERDARELAEGGGEPRTLLRQDLMPGLASGWLSPTPHAAHGTLFPQPRLQLPLGEPVLMDDAVGRGWRVVLGERALHWQPPVPAEMTLLRIASTPQDGSLQPAVWPEADGVLASWWARHDVAAAIVRPDHYVYAVAGNEASLRDELGRLQHRLQGDRGRRLNCLRCLAN